MASTPSINLGFLTVLQEATGYLGGYLVTNGWGRPLEFRLSTAVQPNRVQQILYAATLKPYVCGELIGKTLIEKATIAAHLLITDNPECLSVRTCMEIPIVHVSSTEANDCWATHPAYPEDDEKAREILDHLSLSDLNEPFSRIREAISEARKAGVSTR